MKNMNKRIMNAKSLAGLLTAGFLMFGTTAFAQEIGNQERENVTNTALDEFNQYDANQDQQLDTEEFNTRMQEDRTFETWDMDRDETLNEDEFNEGIRNWDSQKPEQGLEERPEGAINTEEETYNTQDGTTEGLYGQPEESSDIQSNTTTNPKGLGSFNELDENQDGVITRDEFNQGFYNTFDANQDGNLDSDEFNEGLKSSETGTEQKEGKLEEDINLNEENDIETAPEMEQDIETGTEY